MYSIPLCSCQHNLMIYLFAKYIPCGCICVKSVIAQKTFKEKHSGLMACCIGLYFCCLGYAINRRRFLEKLEIMFLC